MFFENFEKYMSYFVGEDNKLLIKEWLQAAQECRKEKKCKTQKDMLNYSFLSPEAEADEKKYGTKTRYVRIFKDSVDEDVWKSYCTGLNVDPMVESIKIYIKAVEGEPDTAMAIKKEQITESK